jgi:outer membrane lipoprotein-sorting protein
MIGHYGGAALLALCITLICPPAQGADLDATDIVRRSDSTMRGTSNYAEMTMAIIRPDWTREMSLKAWSLGDEHSLILVIAPARDKGTVTLKRGTEVWSYLPGIERVIKIPPSMMLQSWLGSDFTNDDLVKESSIVNDYDHFLTGDSVIDGNRCYRILMFPHEDAAVVWGKVVLFITQEHFLQVRTELFDEDSVLTKVLTGDRLKRMDGRMVPSRMTMQPVDKPDQRTVIEYAVLDFDVPLTESYFSLQNMNRVR